MRVIGARAGVALRLSWAPRRLALQLLEFAVDRAQTSLTGHVRPPAHHEGAAPAAGPPEATGGVLEIGEPSVDGVQHCGSPSPSTATRWGKRVMPLTNLGSRRSDKRQTERCQHPAQDVAYDTVEERIHQSVLCGKGEALTQLEEKEVRASREPPHGTASTG